MKQKFSVKWKGSNQLRKQRKYRANAYLHIRRKMMSANLSRDLRKRYGKRNFPLRKGDNVKIMRGEFKGKTGRIDSIDYKKYRSTIDGIFRSKKDGTKVSVYFHPSNLQIKELDLGDVKRKKALERKVNGKSDMKKEEKKESNDKNKGKAGKLKDKNKLKMEKK